MPSPSCAELEHVVPQPRLEVALGLGQVEVRARAAVEQRAWRCGTRRGRSRQERAGDRRAVDEHVAVGQVPAARAHEQRRRCRRRGGTPCRRARELDRPRDGVEQVDAGRRSRCAQVGESESSKSAMKPSAPEFSALIDHLAVAAGPVISTRRSLERPAGGATRQSPSRIVAGLGQEVQRAAGVERGLALGAAVEQLAARGRRTRGAGRPTKASAGGVRISSKRSCAAPADLDALRGRDAHGAPFPAIDASSSSTGW